ncbi:MAG: LuxR family transcriptional regulator [Gammaproteobacteria bacterium]
MNTWQEDQLQLLLDSHCERKSFESILALASELGFDYCAYGFRVVLPLANPKTYMINNYPAAWQSQYQVRNYLAIDPTVRHGLSSNQPILWTDELFRSTAGLWEEARSFGLRYGWAQASRGAKGDIGMLTLARDNEPITEKEFAEKAFKMHGLLETAHLAISERLLPKLIPESEIELTNREIAVLRWTADGKTSAEIAGILNISERTVNFHINNATIKLNAANKTAAAVKAAVLGFL